MEYRLKREMPFTCNNRELKIGDIIDDSDKSYEPLNFLNKNIFEPYYESKYEYGQKLIYNDKLYLIVL